MSKGIFTLKGENDLDFIFFQNFKIINILDFKFIIYFQIKLILYELCFLALASSERVSLNENGN